jgi:hypothetical protein
MTKALTTPSSTTHTHTHHTHDRAINETVQLTFHLNYDTSRECYFVVNVTLPHAIR